LPIEVQSNEELVAVSEPEPEPEPIVERERQRAQRMERLKQRRRNRWHTMTYEIVGYNVTLSLSAEEVNEVIAALEQVQPGSGLLEAWYEFRKQEFGEERQKVH
jgi:hypothetical protein